MVTGRLVAPDLPFNVDYFDDGLGVAVGSMSGSLPIDGLPVNARDALTRWQRVIWPCLDGQPVGAYVVVAHAPFSAQSNEIGFAAARVDLVLKFRRIWSTLVFSQQDQLDMARDILAYAFHRALTHQAAGYPQPATSELPASADLPWFLVDTAVSGVLRDRLDNDDGYQRARDLTVADAITSLSQLQNGFETRLDYSQVAPAFTGDGGLRVTFRLGYPNLGRTTAQGPLEWPDGNVLDWRYASDADEALTMARVFGPGQGAQRIIGPIATDAAMLAGSWPLLMGSTTSTASESATLLGLAEGWLADHPDNIGWVFTVKEDHLVEHEIGDILRYQVAHRLFGPGDGTAGVAGGYMRAIGRRVVPTQPGRMGSVTLSTVEVE
jgi:hypothetical protein